MTTALATIQRPEWAETALQPVLRAIPNADLILQAIPFGAPAAGFRPQVSVVQIDPDPNNGEVFPLSWKQEKGEWVAKTLGYAKAGLMKLASAAGIRFSQPRRMDDRKNSNYCEFSVMAEMLNADGETVCAPGTAGIDLIQWREDRWAEIKAKPKGKDEATLRADLDAEMASFRKHWIGRCETKAMLRAVRALLAIKGNMTPEQVARPKVLMRFVPDANDPAIRKLLVERASGAIATIYGPSHAEVMDDPGRRMLPEAKDDPEAEAPAPSPEEVRSAFGAEPSAANPPPAADPAKQGHPRNAFFAALDQVAGLHLLPASIDGALLKAKSAEGKAERRKLLRELMGREMNPETMTPDDWAACAEKCRAIVRNNTPPPGPDGEQPEEFQF